MCIPLRSFVFTLAAAACFQVTASAATIVPIAGIKGHQMGDTASGDGSLVRAINGVGLTKPVADDITTWRHDNAWQNGWQGGGANTLSGNVGWAVLDLGLAVTDLDDIYLWNVNEQFNPLQRGIQTFKLWYATAPTVTPPNAGGGAQSYNFSSGGWTQLGATLTLAQGTGSSSAPFSGVFDLSGIPSAQFIGIEAITNYGSGTGGSDLVNRTGLAEVVVTSVPEPTTGVLGAMALGALACRRRWA